MTQPVQKTEILEADVSPDVIIVGGGFAGLSAAVALGRSRRSVTVIDAGEPRNAAADGVHNFLTRDGVSPLELLRIAREEARSYGVTIVEGSAVGAVGAVAATGAAGAVGAIGAQRAGEAMQAGDGFVVTLADGAEIRGRRLLVTTGLVDELPEIPGLRERWGKDVVHCPYCHGWEIRDRVLGVLATGPRAMHQALLFRQWSDRVTLYLNDVADPSADELEQLAARGISVVSGAVASLVIEGGSADSPGESTDAPGESADSPGGSADSPGGSADVRGGDGDALTGVVLADGSVHPLEALVVGPNFVARTDLLGGLGLDVVPHPSGAGMYVESGPMGVTAVPGVWIAGNVADLMAQVVSSAAAGLMAGAAINADIMAAELADAVAAYRAR